VENLIEEPLANGIPLGEARTLARLSLLTTLPLLRRLVISYMTYSQSSSKRSETLLAPDHC
jgi:hypothetical protein